ncbi:MAG: (d)CMP kinase [Candidatus Omnitrophica bacterium]|nr:(d)CMP kinase [Candidatus Omnitrophota bacterium]
MIIAIDGPAGAGKSTVAKRLARRLGFLYVDTGAMYRAVTLKAIENSVNIEDEAALIKMAKETNIDLTDGPEGSLTVFLDERDVSLDIREPRITKFVSDVAKIKGVREVMVGLQRKLGSQKDSVLEGRDIGTVVFPEADKKFFLDARFEERTQRRYKELAQYKKDVTEGEVAQDLSNRDNIDSTRKCSPLKKAEDAIYIDTTDMAIEEVVDRLEREVRC